MSLTDRLCFRATDSERVDWDPLIVIYLMLIALFMLVGATKLQEHQVKHQLRHVALFSGVTQIQRLKYATACVAR